MKGVVTTKKIALFIMIAFSTIILTSCSDDMEIGDVFEGELTTYPGVSMSVDGKAYPATATIIITNNSDCDIGIWNATDCLIQIEIDDEWYDLISKDVVTPGIHSDYEKGSSTSVVVNWSARFGALPAGHYRVSHRFHLPDEHDDYVMAAEFSLE